MKLRKNTGPTLSIIYFYMGIIGDTCTIDPQALSKKTGARAAMHCELTNSLSFGSESILKLSVRIRVKQRRGLWALSFPHPAVCYFYRLNSFIG